MKNKKIIVFLFSLVIFVALGFVREANATSATLTKTTGDIKVSNSTSVGYTWARQTAVAYLSDGNYVVTWIDDYDDSDGITPNALLFQRFDSTGEKVGSAVDTGLTTGDDDHAVGVAEVQGGFVVAENTSYRVFDTTGSALTEVLNWDNEFNRSWFGMKKGIGGEFAVSYKIDILPYLETYDNAGDLTGLLALTDHETGQPNFITLKDGSGYLAIWSENEELRGQFVSANLTLSGSDFRIDQSDSPMLSGNDEYELVQNSAGDILFTWYDARIEQSDRYPDKVYGRLMDSTGAFLTDEFIVASDLIEPSFIGENGSQLQPYTPPAMATLDDAFVVAWMEKDGVSQANLAAHIKGVLVDNQGNLMGDIFKMEANENTVNPTRRALVPNITSDDTDNLVMTWFDGRNSYIVDEEQQRVGTEIMVNFWEYGTPINNLIVEDDDSSYKDSKYYHLYKKYKKYRGSANQAIYKEVKDLKKNNYPLYLELKKIYWQYKYLDEAAFNTLPQSIKDKFNKYSIYRHYKKYHEYKEKVFD